MRLLFASLFSGSSGNAVYIAADNDAILIDAGKNNKAIESSLAVLGESPDKIRAVFITHEHSDHVSALPVFCRRHPVPVHFLAPTADAMFDPLPDSAVLHESLYSASVGPFTVESFYTPHDSACAVGYSVSVAGLRLGVATDMGMLSKNVVAALSGCFAALIETNYDPHMLAVGPYYPALKARISGNRGHLSNPDGALLASVLAFSGAKHLLLGHLSAENNTPDLALAAVLDEFSRRGVSANVLVADRDRPTVLLDIEV